MSAAPSEPEKYSIDEMIDRLKSPSSGNTDKEGERVIRADGTEAIRVRKRKRRTDQPHKLERSRSRRSLILQVSAAVALVTLSGLGIGAAIVFANSPMFREGLITKIAQSTGATTEISQFRMNPKSANAGGLKLTWPEGNVLNNLNLRGAVAEIFPSSFLGKAMTGEEVTVADGVLSLRLPEEGKPVRAEPALSGSLPIHFKRYRIPKFLVTLGDPKNPDIRITESEASLYPSALNGRTQFSMNQGNLMIKGWPKMRLHRAFMEFRGDEIDIVGLRLLDETDNLGVFELSGTLSPYSPDRLSTLGVELESFPLSGLTGPALGRLISGKVDTLDTTKSNFLSFYPKRDSSATLAIAFRNSITSKIELSGFPFLFGLSQVLDDEWFQRPVFEGGDAGAVFFREAGVVSLKDISFESKGRMALRGSISMGADKNLFGNLEVGLTEAMIASAPAGGLQSMFSPTKEGFRWITLKIGGPATAPTDDFKELYMASGAKNSQARPRAESKVSTFEELTSPK